MMGRQIQEIKRLYLRATETTIEQDLTRAVEILKTLPDEQSRARAAVYMDGLSQMRSEWRLATRRPKRSTGGTLIKRIGRKKR